MRSHSLFFIWLLAAAAGTGLPALGIAQEDPADDLPGFVQGIGQHFVAQLGPVAITVQTTETVNVRLCVAAQDALMLFVEGQGGAVSTEVRISGLPASALLYKSEDHLKNEQGVQTDTVDLRARHFATSPDPHRPAQIHDLPRGNRVESIHRRHLGSSGPNRDLDYGCDRDHRDPGRKPYPGRRRSHDSARRGSSERGLFQCPHGHPERHHPKRACPRRELGHRRVRWFGGHHHSRQLPQRVFRGGNRCDFCLR